MRRIDAHLEKLLRKYYPLSAIMQRSLNAGATQPNPFIDPQGYRAYVTEKDQAFQAKLAEQSAE